MWLIVVEQTNCINRNVILIQILCEGHQIWKKKYPTFNLFMTSESPKYSNPPIFCCLQNFVFFLIKSRAKYWNHATFSNSDSMGVQLKALKYVIQNYLKKWKHNFLDNWTIWVRISWRFQCRKQVIDEYSESKLLFLTNWLLLNNADFLNHNKKIKSAKIWIHLSSKY